MCRFVEILYNFNFIEVTKVKLYIRRNLEATDINLKKIQNRFKNLNYQKNYIYLYIWLGPASSQPPCFSFVNNFDIVVSKRMSHLLKASKFNKVLYIHKKCGNVKVVKVEAESSKISIWKSSRWYTIKILLNLSLLIRSSRLSSIFSTDSNKDDDDDPFELRKLNNNSNKG